jgi:hypothetical protein
MSNDESNKDSASSKPESKSENSFDWNSLKFPNIKEYVHTVVDATNRTLADVETKVSAWKEPVVQTWHQLEESTASTRAQLFDLYKQRYQYGPAIVAGTGLTAGALVSLRRGGRLWPGAVAALMGGGAAAGLLYGGLENVELPKSWSDRFKRE